MFVVFKVRGVIGGGVWGGACGGGSCVFECVVVETPSSSLLRPLCLPSSSDPEVSEVVKVVGGPARVVRVLFSPVFLLIFDILFEWARIAIVALILSVRGSSCQYLSKL